MDEVSGCDGRAGGKLEDESGRVLGAAARMLGGGGGRPSVGA